MPSSGYGININDEHFTENIIQLSLEDAKIKSNRAPMRNNIMQSKLYQKGNVTVHKIKDDLCKVVVKASAGNTHWGPSRKTPIQSMQAALEIKLIADLVKTYPYSKNFKLLFEEVFKDSDYYDLYGVPSSHVIAKLPTTIPMAIGSGEDTVIQNVTMESMLDIMRKAIEDECNG